MNVILPKLDVTGDEPLKGQLTSNVKVRTRRKKFVVYNFKWPRPKLPAENRRCRRSDGVHVINNGVDERNSGGVEPETRVDVLIGG